MGSFRDREVACSASDLQGLNFESCDWRAVSSHHSQAVLPAQFSLYVHKSGLKPDSSHLLLISVAASQEHCLPHCPKRRAARRAGNRVGVLHIHGWVHHVDIGILFTAVICIHRAPYPQGGGGGGGGSSPYSWRPIREDEIYKPPLSTASEIEK